MLNKNIANNKSALNINVCMKNEMGAHEGKGENDGKNGETQLKRNETKPNQTKPNSTVSRMPNDGLEKEKKQTISIVFCSALLCSAPLRLVSSPPRLCSVLFCFVAYSSAP